MYYLIRMCEAAIQISSSHLETVNQPDEVWALASKQYAAFPPGQYEWLALKRRLDTIDPSYKH